MEKWNLIVDVERCENCNNCTLAAKDEYIGNNHEGYSAPAPKVGADLITIERKRRGDAPLVDAAYLVKMCNHCDDAPCQKVGGEAVTKRDDGIVIIDPEKSKGRKDIVDACPYGSIIWNEEQQIPQNFIFDAHLLDQGWKEPRLVQSCPTLVFEAFKTSDSAMQKRVVEEDLEVLQPELGTKPRVYYKNLYRFSKCFIGGTVIAEVEGIEECVNGAEVVVSQNDSVIGSTKTNAYGEFKVDKLDPNSGVYHVDVSHSRYGSVHSKASLGESQYLGDLKLTS